MLRRGIAYNSALQKFELHDQLRQLAHMSDGAKQTDRKRLKPSDFAAARVSDLARSHASHFSHHDPN